MTNNEIPFDNPLPSHVIEAARAECAAPTDPAYWSRLEQRVMTRIANVAAAPLGWWQVLGGWTRGGLIAAVALLAVVGALLLHVHRQELNTASEALLRVAPAESLVVPSGVLSEEDDPRGETFRDVISR